MVTVRYLYLNFMSSTHDEMNMLRVVCMDIKTGVKRQ